MIRWIDKLSGKWPTGAYVDISELAWNCLEKFPEERPLMFKVVTCYIIPYFVLKFQFEQLGTF